MRRLTKLSLFIVLACAGSSAYPIEVKLQERVASCVEWLTKRAAAPLSRQTRLNRRSQHNRRVIERYEFRQVLALADPDQQHKITAHYASILPQFQQIFQSRVLDGNQVFFVLNLGDDELYEHNAKSARRYAPFEVLGVMRDSYLVVKSFPADVLNNVAKRPAPGPTPTLTHGRPQTEPPR